MWRNVVAGLLIALLIVAAVATIAESSRCTKAGGTLMKTVAGYACVKAITT